MKIVVMLNGKIMGSFDRLNQYKVNYKKEALHIISETREIEEGLIEKVNVIPNKIVNVLTKHYTDFKKIERIYSSSSNSVRKLKKVLD